MAQTPYRANLQTMAIPMLSEYSGRTVIVGQQDQVFVSGVSIGSTAGASDSIAGVPSDRGVPQIYYAHNVMPSTYGLQSIGYNVEYSGVDWQGVLPSELKFKDATLLQGAQIVASKPVGTGYKTYISAPKSGANSVFTLDPLAKRWKLVSGAPEVTDTTRITVATVNGVSYIYFSNIGCYVYDNNANALVARTLTGLDAPTILGIVAANGYLIAFSQSAIAWSSVVNVEDFTPSDVSGAGGGQVQEAKGKIITAAVTALGFILYTEANAVSVIYSGNASFPWNLKAIPSSGGVASAEMVSAEQIGGYQQVYSTNGLQQIGHTGSKTVAPQITDFIAGQLFEDYDTDTGKFSKTDFTWTMRKGLSVIADRYILVSYGLWPTADLTHAIVLDVAQNRMGKLKLTHAFSFELRSLQAQITETPRGSIAFLQSNGDIKSVNFNYTADAPDSIMLLGKYQYVRQRMLELHEVELENVRTGADFRIEALPALDGKNFQAPVAGYLRQDTGDYRDYMFDDCVGTNVSLLFKGKFNILSLVLWFSPHGRF